MFNLPLLKEYPVISTSDPAIDAEKSDIKKYSETLNRKHLALTGEPTVFWLRPITTREWVHLISKATGTTDGDQKLEATLDTATLAVRQTLVRVENFKIGGEELVITRNDGLVDEKCIELFDFNLIMEISAACREVSRLPSLHGDGIVA